MSEHKRCNHCNTMRHESFFYKDRGKKSGLASLCKDCNNKVKAAARARNSMKTRRVASVDWVLVVRILEAWERGEEYRMKQQSLGSRWVAVCTWQERYPDGRVTNTDDYLYGKRAGALRGWNRVTLNDVIAQIASEDYLSDRLLFTS